MDQMLATGGIITLVHFMCEIVSVPTDSMPEGPPVAQLRIACMPNMTEFHQTMYHPNYQRTDDARAVSCPACKKTRYFVEMQEKLKVSIK